jgi:hypothetical protein
MRDAAKLSERARAGQRRKFPWRQASVPDVGGLFIAGQDARLYGRQGCLPPLALRLRTLAPLR